MARISRGAVLGLALLSTTAFAADGVRVIVVFHGAPDPSVIAAADGHAVLDAPRSRLVAAMVPAARVGELARDPAVAYVVRDAEAAVLAQEMPWGIDRVDADLTWSAPGGSSGAGVRIAVIDTGIKADHADFRDSAGASRVILGPTYISGTKNSMDDNGHGTHCAGIAGASNNSIGVVGVAPASTLVAVKVLNRKGSGWYSAIIAGIDWAADNARVISLSLGGGSDVQALHDAVDNAVAKGVVVCAAAGNSGDSGSPPSYPGAYASVVAVAATDIFDGVPIWSNRGAYVDIAAPGVGVKSTWKDGGYRTISGTSMATPHVAGAAALLIAKGNSAAATRTKLESTADDVNAATSPGKDSVIGNGLLDVQEAVTGIQTLP